MKSCRYVSYNYPQEYQVDPTVILDFPFEKDKTICVDFCISETIKRLWAWGLVTHGSCCGHGDCNPNVILENNANSDLVAKARRCIAKEDPREWDILSWVLTKAPQS